MNTSPPRSTFEKRRRWHCQLGVLVCLVALGFALFGHIEVPEARSLNTQSIAVVVDHLEDAADHNTAPVSHHCMHQSQCTLQAVLPSNHFPGAFGVMRTKLAADLLGTSRTISPHRHPPKSSSF